MLAPLSCHSSLLSTLSSFFCPLSCSLLSPLYSLFALSPLSSPLAPLSSLPLSPLSSLLSPLSSLLSPLSSRSSLAHSSLVARHVISYHSAREVRLKLCVNDVTSSMWPRPWPAGAHAADDTSWIEQDDDDDGRGLHSLTSQLNLRTFGNTSLTLELNLSTFETHPRVNLGYTGTK